MSGSEVEPIRKWSPHCIDGKLLEQELHLIIFVHAPSIDEFLEEL